MGTSDVLKVFKITRAISECNLKSFQNIKSYHKSRKFMHEQFMQFFLLYPQQNHVSLHALGAHYKLKHFSRVSKVLVCFI